MKKIFYYSAVAIVLLMIVSCSGKKVEVRVSKIDSLTKVLTALDKDLKEIRLDTVKNRFQIYKRTNDSIAKHIKEIRTDETWKYICAYQQVNEPFEEMSLSYYTLGAKIDSSVKQLDNLRHDVKAKLLSDKEYNQFFQNESKSVDAVYEQVTESVETIEKQMKNFDTVHPYLVKLLKNKTGKKNTK